MTQCGLQLEYPSAVFLNPWAASWYRSVDQLAPGHTTVFAAYHVFTRVSTITVRTLRGSNFSLRPPRLKSRHGQNCFAYRESSVWNSLPSEIKSSRTFGSFQKKRKAMLAERN